MKKTILILLLFALSFLPAIQSENIQIRKSQNIANIQKRDGRPVIYEETFETEDNGWTHYDGTLPSSMWHLDDFNTPDGTGLSWWMGIPGMETYQAHSYLVLDTPEITVPADGHLTFSLNYDSENPAGVPEPYDGWDGGNVRISTDGETWTVIEGIPSYNCESLYSFGFEHGEGPGIPGWCHNSTGWIDADFDLSAYAGQNVQIRFAFASDPGYMPDYDLHGMIVDNIFLGNFVHNFDDGNQQGMISGSLVPSGGDIWYRGQPGDAPSPTYAMICQNDEGTYNQGMMNYLESPTITLPETGEIKADFMIKGLFDDEDNFPEVDFFGWEVSPDNGVTWYYMSNPGGDPDSNNYVYSDAPEVWSSMIESYTLNGRLDGCDGMYEGADVKFRIYFQTDHDEPIGTGIMIDDFTITNVFYPGPAPENLQAVYDPVNGFVNLTWDAIVFGGSEGWLNWDSGENVDGIGTDSATIIDAAARFTATDLMDYEGGTVTSIKIFPKEEACNYTIRIWDEAGVNVIYEQDIPDAVIDEWNEVTLETPLVLASGTEYWFGYKADTTGGYPCGCDSGPMVANRGGYLRQNNGDWAQLASYGLDYNWNIQAYVTAEDGEPIIIESTLSREVTGYNVYRSEVSGGPYELLGSVDPIDIPGYTDIDPLLGQDNFYIVAALYDGNQGMFSEEAVVWAYPEIYEISHDDGTAESGFNVGGGNSMAVQFTPDIDSRNPGFLTHLRVFVETYNSGQMIIKIWEDDDGIPGDQLVQFVYPSTNLFEGWNAIEIPNPPTFDAADTFYIGIFEMAGLSAIGFDEDSFGHSYSHSTASGWVANTEGNIMIRAIYELPMPYADDEDVTFAKYALSNYPNSFNPSTTIVFTTENAESSEIIIYNVKGQIIQTFTSHSHPELVEGSVVWNDNDELGNAVSSGIYFYKLKTGGSSQTKKMILLK